LFVHSLRGLVIPNCILCLHCLLALAISLCSTIFTSLSTSPSSSPFTFIFFDLVPIRTDITRTRRRFIRRSYEGRSPVVPNRALQSCAHCAATLCRVRWTSCNRTDTQHGGDYGVFEYKMNSPFRVSFHTSAQAFLSFIQSLFHSQSFIYSPSFTHTLSFRPIRNRRTFFCIRADHLLSLSQR